MEDSADSRLHRWFGPVTPQRLAAGIYGLVIGDAVLVAAGGESSLGVIEAEVGAALVVYWLAEMYADVLGHHAAGERLGRAGIAAALRRGLAMIELSVLPLVVVALGVAAGLSLAAASTVASAVTMLLLAGFGLLAGWRLGLTRMARIGTALGAGVVGLLMVTLKIALH
ncbi:MAG TPA: hypothetical protein VHX59_05730 [Mycobacteriales bacterium]|nr:hypothetical protein [Mycobacteriales bacterium]